MNYARDGHRERKGRHYKNRSGRLSKATRADGSFGSDLRGSIELYVDLSKAPYGEWIITGERKGKNGMITWNGGKGDPFIDETMTAKRQEVEALIVDFFNRATDEFNRRK